MKTQVLRFLRFYGAQNVDGILGDLWSSHQFDVPKRIFYLIHVLSERTDLNAYMVAEYDDVNLKRFMMVS
jgi:16S rRNA (cytosine1402-N4)-methyltransferase